MRLKINRKRFERALDIRILTIDEFGDKLPEHHYLAIGGSQPHYLHTKPYWDCDCADWNWRPSVVCKHLLKALIIEDDPKIQGVLDYFDYDRNNNTIRTPDQQE